MKISNHSLLAACLGLLMLATRTNHFTTSLHLPDASLALFFLAGFYLRGAWVFPALLASAVLADYIAIAHFGVSDFCVSPAYAFLIPAYAAPWLAGLWLRGHADWHWVALFKLSGAWLVGSGLAFMISDTSFYWLSGKYPTPNGGQYLELAGDYLWPYLSSPLLYIGLALVLHIFLRVLDSQRSVATEKEMAP